VFYTYLTLQTIHLVYFSGCAFALKKNKFIIMRAMSSYSALARVSRMRLNDSGGGFSILVVIMFV
ncbi:hypothetical protein, partial [Escherichia coli]|uniref:hypothetical protein n=1 Tax=Escherichia coli TaxID=562 RepID=UPI001BFE623D